METLNPASSLEKGLKLLNVFHDVETPSLTLTKLISLSGLPRSTVHRLLAQLCALGLIQKDPHSKRYSLGYAAFRGAVRTLFSVPFGQRCAEAASHLAQSTGWIAYVVARRAGSSVCLHRFDGKRSPLSSATFPGTSRPLGVGPGSTALLAALPEGEFVRLIAHHSANYRKRGFSLESIEQGIQQTQVRGFSFTCDDITPGLAGIGTVIKAGDGQSFGISLGFPSDLATGRSIDHLVTALTGCAESIAIPHS